MQMRAKRIDPALLNHDRGDDAATIPIFLTGSPAAYAKATTALEVDYIGDRVPTGAVVPLASSDTVPDDISTTATLTVGGGSVFSSIDTVGDQDFYAVTLTAGVDYQIGMYGTTAGPNAIPLSDSYVEIYDAAGNLVTSADGGATTPMNEANSGFDVLTTFTPGASGTYYINARAYDNIAEDGGNGDLVGDYELFINPAPADAYQPYYDTDSPLYAIDWGTQVDGTVRNPDGVEGPRTTANPPATPDADHDGVAGKNVVKIYFAQAGDVFVTNDPTNPGLPPAIVAVGAKDFERTAVFTALGEFSKVADVVYQEVFTREEADFFYVTYSGTPGPGVSLLGSMSPPGESDEGLAQFNSGDYRWTATNLAQGGFSFVTLIHEFGHGHGLAHPHDNGGHSGIMRGVESEGPVADYTLGDYDLNQGVFTMMSYEDGWQTSPYGNAATDVAYGYLGGLMAFDIAAIQDKYGVNEEWATGNDSYVLKDVNAAGTYYSSIWDAGGIDRIVYTGARDTLIDLRPATLEYETGGGGFVSYAYGVFGGYTIANGVVIENAASGSGNDRLIGNAADNALSGGGGNDMLAGGLGRDRLDGGAGSDTADYAGAAAAVTVNLVTISAQNTGGGGTDTLISIENVTGSAFDDTLTGNAFANVLTGAAGNDRLAGGAGSDTLDGGDGIDTADYYRATSGVLVNLALATTQASGAAGTDTLISIETLIGTGFDDQFTGNGADNGLIGNGGNDLLNGGAGNDDLNGGANVDTASYAGAAAGVTVSLGVAGAQDTIGAGTDTLVSIENLTGSALDDRLTGGINANVLTGGTGNDTLDGGATGNDTLDGGAGNDVLRGQNGNDLLIGYAGNDLIDGGTGTDTVSYKVASGGVTISLAITGAQTVHGGHGLDTIVNVENVAGSDFADTLTGSATANVLTGNGGKDMMAGGGGNDRFVYLATSDSSPGANADRITDFAAGDILDLAAIDADTGTAGINEAFTRVGSFSGVAGQLILAFDAGTNTTTLRADDDGDGIADFSILFSGDATGTTANWVL